MSESREKRYFFDVHMHAFNMSHPGLLAFINRLLKKKIFNFGHLFRREGRKGIVNQKVFYLLLVLSVFLFFNGLSALFIFLDLIGETAVNQISKFFFQLTLIFDVIMILILCYLVLIGLELLYKEGRKVINALSVTENDLSRQFRFIEYDYMALNSQLKKFLFENTHDYSDYESFSVPLDKIWSSEQVNRKFSPITGEQFDNVILCPLMMDFQHKGYSALDKSDVYYNMPPRKPIVEQCRDLFHGIRDYCKVSRFKLLRVFPFMGITPSEYNLGVWVSLGGSYSPDFIDDFRVDPLQQRIFRSCFWLQKKKNKTILWIAAKPLDQHGNDLTPVFLQQLRLSGWDAADINDVSVGFNSSNLKKNSIIRMLLKYFGEYPKADRMKVFIKKFGEHFAPHDGSRSRLEMELKKFADVGNHFFAGIKVYPPLGFNPWPMRKQYSCRRDFVQDRRKVRLIYSFCQGNCIPITTHCGDGGFNIEGGYSPDPVLWEPVLRNYRGIKINFAHFGKQRCRDGQNWDRWFSTIVDYIEKYDNVYADLSCHSPKGDNYKELAGDLKKWLDEKSPAAKKHLSERILFGTDFMVNLFGSDSYNSYLEDYKKQNYFNKSEKILQVVDNPMRFLFE